MNKTRLIELSCESTSPEVAAQFLNSMAAEFSDYSSQSRTQTALHTGEWLAAQIEDSKSKVQEAEDHLRDFIAASGNVFAGQDTTLEDTKLLQLKGELAKIQAERIQRQTRYELTKNNPPESLAEVLDDPALRNYQQQLESLKRDRAALETIYTPKHEKVRKIDVQVALLQKSYQNEITSVVGRVKNDYEASLRQEKLLTAAYGQESQRVGSEAGRAAQYNNLKREVETQRTMYQTLLGQLNEANLTSSVPVNPISVVEARGGARNSLHAPAGRQYFVWRDVGRCAGRRLGVSERAHGPQHQVAWQFPPPFQRAGIRCDSEFSPERQRGAERGRAWWRENPRAACGGRGFFDRAGHLAKRSRLCRGVFPRYAGFHSEEPRLRRRPKADFDH